jgi:hypothetical protein
LVNTVIADRANDGLSCLRGAIMATWAHAAIRNTACTDNAFEASGRARNSSAICRVSRTIIPLLAHIALIAACISLALVKASWYSKAEAGRVGANLWIIRRSRARRHSGVLAVRSHRARVLRMIGMLLCGIWADVAVVAFVSHHHSRGSSYVRTEMVKIALAATRGSCVRKVAGSTCLWCNH